MDKKEINQRLVKAQQEIEECKRLLEKPVISAKEKMQEIWRKCTMFKYSNDNCRTYYSEDKKFIIQQNWKDKKLYYSWEIYFLLKEEFKLNDNDINSLVIDIVSKDLNCSGQGPVGQAAFWFFGFLNN